MNEPELKNPEVFSAELHFALLNEGLRGPLMRRLMRLARTEAELGRIFEVKVNEFRRYLRETRIPTFWNFPIRASEWAADHIRFTPPREVFMTLVYVVLAVMGLEIFKHYFAPRQADESFKTAARLSVSPGLVPAYHGPTTPKTAAFDQRMIEEVERATQSEEWRKAFAAQLATQLAAVDFEPLLRSKLDAMLTSPEFSERLKPQPDPSSPLSSPEVSNPVAQVESSAGNTSP